MPQCLNEIQCTFPGQTATHCCSCYVTLFCICCLLIAVSESPDNARLCDRRGNGMLQGCCRLGSPATQYHWWLPGEHYCCLRLNRFSRHSAKNIFLWTCCSQEIVNNKLAFHDHSSVLLVWSAFERLLALVLLGSCRPIQCTSLKCLIFKKMFVHLATGCSHLKHIFNVNI